MPSLPRIRRTRARDLVAAPSAPQAPPAELSAAGLTWIHLDAPSLTHAQELAARFGWHPLDVEDVLRDVEIEVGLLEVQPVLLV